MKNIYLILVVILLFGVGGGVAFFVLKKKKDSKKTSPQAPSTPVVNPITENKEIATTANKKPVTASPVANKATASNEAIKFDIVVSEVDTQNRRFDYSMHYQGIRYKGVFEDGVTAKIIQVKKGFGAFSIQHLEAARQATKANKMNKKPIKNDLVSLSITDLKGQTIKEVVVNLSTGTKKIRNLNNSTVLRTI